MEKILIFQDQSFPGFKPIQYNQLEEATICDGHTLREALCQDYDVFVNTHGSYFPVDAFCAVFEFLKLGKGFVQLDGVPFLFPVGWEKKKKIWEIGKKQLSYLRELNIHSTLDVECTDICNYIENTDRPIGKGLLPILKVANTHNLIMIPTKNKYVEKEWGSVGSMDVFITPLVKGITKEKEHYSSPVVLLENRAGTYKGGRWIFVNQEIEVQEKEALEAIKALAHFVALGVREISIKPSFATYYKEEKASFKIEIEHQKCPSKMACQVVVTCGEDTIVEKNLSLEGTCYPRSTQIMLDTVLLPGNYSIKASIHTEDGEMRQIEQGFCVQDAVCLQKKNRISCGKDYFIIDGKPTPVVGTTYMSGEYSRAFLQLPNPARWLKDMADMKKQGINWIRTGMWCNWRNFMLDDGHFSEPILRAIDAFLQCAATYDLQVTFTFFTFVPEPWEGTHPYLDRRSLDAQKRFIAHIVDRHKNTTNVDWDLINEPFTSDHPSQRKLDNDREEHDAFRNYMKENYASEEKMTNDLDRCMVEGSSFNSLMAPERSDINFDITDMGDSKNGLIWQDYIRFTVEMFSDWVKEMKATIQQVAPNHLVTVGQDEALRGQRPTPLLYGELVDYNAQHTWWLLDDLVWDTVFTKYFNKPLLVQETGVMYAEKPNNEPRRTEEDVAHFVERKYAYAYGTKCAGAIQWIWNTNYFLKSANESHIGAIRADGSKKPELKIYKAFSDFFRVAEDYISDIKKQEEVAVVFPFTNDFSNRNFAQHATTHLTKVLTYAMKQGFFGVSEFDLAPLLEVKPKVIIVPSAHHFNNKQFTELLSIVEQLEATLVFTGPISLDEYFTETTRAEKLVGHTSVESIARFETFTYKGKTYEVSFDNTYVSKAFKEGSTSSMEVKEVAVGKGKLVYLGLPIELAAESVVVEIFYKQLLKENGVTPSFEILKGNYKGVFVSKIYWEKGALYTIVNESGATRELSIKDKDNENAYTLITEKDGSDLFIIDTAGNVISSYKEKTIHVN